ncbi:hypothetical protein Tco_0433319 [Tanacetum coccineum]
MVPVVKEVVCLLFCGIGGVSSLKGKISVRGLHRVATNGSNAGKTNGTSIYRNTKLEANFEQPNNAHFWKADTSCHNCYARSGNTIECTISQLPLVADAGFAAASCLCVADAGVDDFVRPTPVVRSDPEQGRLNFHLGIS